MNVSHVDEGTLHAYLDGELSPAEAQGVDAHLAQCADCRERLDSERALLARATELLALAAPPDRELPPFRAGDLKPPPRLWWQVRLPVAWAATVALALGIGTYLGSDVFERQRPASATSQGVGVADSIAAVPRLRTGAPVAAGARGQAEVSATRPSPAPKAQLAPSLPSPAPASASAVAAAVDEAKGIMRPAPQNLMDLRYQSAPVRQGPIDVDSARRLLGRNPVVVADLPIRGMYDALLTGYSGVVIVEQTLDSNTAIQVVNGRRAFLAREEVGIPRAARKVAAGAEKLNDAPLEFLTDVQGPLSADSLASLRRQLRPLRP